MQRKNLVSMAILFLLASVSFSAKAQTTAIKTEYLMTYMAQLDAPYPIDSSLVIVNVKPGGWAKGSKISGTFIPPGGDWLRVLPSGALRLDVRATLKTDDGALIYITYNGIIQHSAESADKLNKGELLTAKDIPYFIAAPTFETSSEKYAWLNSVQLAIKMVELKLGEGGYVKYDVFVLR
ncbi:MAG: DUF3237 domain-containing protein [Betaproteobacteria bacterium]